MHHHFRSGVASFCKSYHIKVSVENGVENLHKDIATNEEIVEASLSDVKCSDRVRACSSLGFPVSNCF